MNLEPVVTCYTISPFARDDIDGSRFTIDVERYGDGWVVTRGKAYLSKTGSWNWSSSEERDSKWWASAHVFGHDDAIRAAQTALPKLRINGHTAADLLASRRAP